MWERVFWFVLLWLTVDALILLWWSGAQRGPDGHHGRREE